MTVTFLGTGTSQGVPVIACECPVCTSPDPRDNRLRCSVWLQTAGKSLVIDSGPDFRQQMLRAQVRQLDAILYTHLHKDHVAGMDDVRAYNYRTRAPMPLYADALTLQRLREEFPYVFDGTNYPGIPQVITHELDGGPFVAAGVPVTPVPVLHHRLPVLGFRVGAFAYVTDANHIPPASMELLCGLDVLVLNALRHEPHVSHFTLREALAVITELRPRQAYLTHISHLLGTHEEVTRQLPPGVALAYDGLTLTV
ncbi:MAG: MBL fold metallo-hydrolase [Bacteroidetes bacterium]|nr:MBL fold metallo-hydrolase [Bacteroidota bacterium]